MLLAFIEVDENLVTDDRIEMLFSLFDSEVNVFNASNIQLSKLALVVRLYGGSSVMPHMPNSSG